MKYYIDSAIWRDLHENRTDRFRPLGEWAFELFRQIRERKEIVLYSELVVDELSIEYSKTMILTLFSTLSEENLLQKTDITEIEIREAVKLKRKYSVPFGDALHAILAKHNGAIMVTRDHHFEQFQELVDVNKPEDLI